MQKSYQNPVINKTATNQGSKGVNTIQGKTQRLCDAMTDDR